MVHLALLWHMHQPPYADPASGRLLLPWVRLHGASAYRDMAALLAAHPGVKATLSVSPSLLDQFAHYAAGGRDVWEELTERPAAELSPEERIFLTRHFFSLHWASVLEPIPAYHALLEKRGRELPAGGLAQAAAAFTVGELRDLQLLFNLAWLGTTAVQDPAVAQLLERGRDFSEEDKRPLLERQRAVLAEVLPAWRSLVARGQVEVCASPYYHPILPLIIDSNVARRATPEARLPERFCFPEDAELQVQRALDCVERELGARPQGLWPAEGAVSPEAVRLAARSGARWIAADSEVLFRSLDDRGGTPGRRRLYQPYHLGGCAICFRDAGLSNAVARDYASWADPAAAAADVVRRVQAAGEVARVDGARPPLVLLALPGENPWEAYPRRGHDFLDALYAALERTPDVRTVTLAEHLAAHPPTVGIEHLHSGSWVEANYAVWIGDPDKNRAWNILGRARRRLARAAASAETDEAARAQALEHLLCAECSDWFWWLGEPFSSVEESVYEELFRGHVMAAYRALGDSPPAELSRPIADGAVVETLRQPTSTIAPRIDGRRTSFFEWRGAGFYRVPAGGSVFATRSFIAGLYWGFDAGRIFLRLDPVEDYREDVALSLADLQLWFELSAPERTLVGRLHLAPPAAPCELRLSTRDRAGRESELGAVQEVAYQEVVELAAPLGRLGLLPGTRHGLSVHFARGGEQLARVPAQGVIELEVPDGEY